MYRLEIEPEDGCGWIKDEEGNVVEYLSTHTFYGRNHKHSTKVLQDCGFNVTIANWDEP